ncbi:MAG: alpha/beta fold hydrolase [Halobacteriovoraceae bacterium]|nr:alpha/beta fold hydrolase [Halobacteriovoraceae bacterium]
MKKSILEHQSLYISTFVKNKSYPNLLWIHGGPGLNCAILEQMIEQYSLFQELNANLVLYDQRGCGRSKCVSTVTHNENIDDLNNLISFLKDQNIFINVILGHSYGAKVLNDFIKKIKTNLGSIFLSTSQSILTPRINNLILDIEYLNREFPEIETPKIEELQFLELSEIWNLTEKLVPYFNQNPKRNDFYWYNQIVRDRVFKLQTEINSPINDFVFKTVRKDLYSRFSNLTIDFEHIPSPKIWINGKYDKIMESKVNENILLVDKSAHYPHFENQKEFVNLINRFLLEI